MKVVALGASVALLLCVVGCGDADSPSVATTSPETPQIALSVRAESRGAQAGVTIDAEVRHLGGPDVVYLAGCTAACYPHFHDSIAIEVLDPQGRRVFLESPCDSPYYCPEDRIPLRAGDMLRRRVVLAAHTWERGEEGSECGVCAEISLLPGTYGVVATLEQPLDAPRSFEASTSFVLD